MTEFNTHTTRPRGRAWTKTCSMHSSNAPSLHLISLSHIHKELWPFELANTQVNRRLETNVENSPKSLRLCLAECSTSKLLLINWRLVPSCEDSLLNRWCSSGDRRSYNSRVLFCKWLNHSKSQRQYRYTYLINTMIYTPAHVQPKSKMKLPNAN